MSSIRRILSTPSHRNAITSAVILPTHLRECVHSKCSLYFTFQTKILYAFPFSPMPAYLLTYLLTPWCRVLLVKLTDLQLVKKFPAFHGTRKFITALTSVRHLSLSWASPIQSIYPHLTSRRSVLTLSTHLRQVSPVVPCLRFPHQDPIHPPLHPHTRHMSSPSHSSRFYHLHNIGRGVQII